MIPYRKGRIPSQRNVLGGYDVPTDLPPESVPQWLKVIRNQGALRKYTRAKARPEHEDHVFGMALYNFHVRLKSGPVQGDPTAYMKTVIRNEAKKNFAKIAAKRRNELPVEAIPEGQVSTDFTTGVQLMESLDVAACSLTEKQLLAFILFEDEGMTCPQISEAFDGKISAGAVRQLVVAARKKLADPETRRRLGLEK